MSDTQFSQPTAAGTLPLPPPAGRPLAAWLVIACVVLGTVAIVARAGGRQSPQLEAARSVVMELQAKYLVGAASFSPQTRAVLYQQARPLNTGGAWQRLRFVILAGELAGPQEARQQLDALDRHLAAGGKALVPAQAAYREALAALYADFAEGRFTAPSLTAAQRQVLQGDWFGRLALAPQQSPERALRQEVLAGAGRVFLLLLAAVLGGGFLALLGAAGLVLFLALAATGKLLPAVAADDPGNLYAETFAVWLVLFNGLSLAASLAGAAARPLYVSGLLALFSLSALAWPVWRGLSWQQVRRDLGLGWGSRPALEPLCGVAGYVMTVPLILAGWLLTLLLVLAARGPAPAAGEAPSFETPSHPIMSYLLDAGWWARLQVLFVACIAAPLVEEIMFRGALYRHLRGATQRLGAAASAAASALLNALLFALIHPQGLVAVPALAGVALGLCLTREWRGSLVACMVLHGLHNGLLMMLLLVALG